MASLQFEMDGFQVADAIRGDGDDVALCLVTLSRFLARGELNCSAADVAHHFRAQYGNDTASLRALAAMLIEASVL